LEGSAFAHAIRLVFSAISVGIKHLHDRGKSGWWILVFIVLPVLLDSASPGGLVAQTSAMAVQLVSLALAAWGIIELGFLRGSVGSN
jgi:uncharacterized membrane protein YhaH (DUF805 family)